MKVQVSICWMTKADACALVCASNKKHYHATRLLLDRGAFVDCKDGEGCTALML